MHYPISSYFFTSTAFCCLKQLLLSCLGIYFEGNLNRDFEGKGWQPKAAFILTVMFFQSPTRLQSSILMKFRHSFMFLIYTIWLWKDPPFAWLHCYLHSCYLKLIQDTGLRSCEPKMIFWSLLQSFKSWEADGKTDGRSTDPSCLCLRYKSHSHFLLAYSSVSTMLILLPVCCSKCHKRQWLLRVR